MTEDSGSGPAPDLPKRPPPFKPTTPPSLGLPKSGGSVRGLGGKFQAGGPTGTGSVRVPIAVSPCRDGAEPVLALEYDSGQGYGPFGTGWRCPRRAYPAQTRASSAVDRTLAAAGTRRHRRSELRLRRPRRRGHCGHPHRGCEPGSGPVLQEEPGRRDVRSGRAAARTAVAAGHGRGRPAGQPQRRRAARRGPVLRAEPGLLRANPRLQLGPVHAVPVAAQNRLRGPRRPLPGRRRRRPDRHPGRDRRRLRLVLLAVAGRLRSAEPRDPGPRRRPRRGRPHHRRQRDHLPGRHERRRPVRLGAHPQRQRLLLAESRLRPVRRQDHHAQPAGVRHPGLLRSAARPAGRHRRDRPDRHRLSLPAGGGRLLQPGRQRLGRGHPDLPPAGRGAQQRPDRRAAGHRHLLPGLVEHRSGRRRTALRYVDLLHSTKPHLLSQVGNGLGAQTTITYAPSPQFYLEDRLAGRPWATWLPFVVQTVAQVELTDAVALTTSQVRYRNAHGYYDGVERELRGFARVDSWDPSRCRPTTAPIRGPARSTRRPASTGFRRSAPPRGFTPGPGTANARTSPR